MTGMWRNYIRHPDGRIEVCDDLIEFAKWYGEDENRRIALDAVPYGPGDKEAVLVSTIFLGMDHNFGGKGAPVLFETLAQCPDGTDFANRYRTEEEARTGHERILQQVEEHMALHPQVLKALDAVIEPLDDPLTGFEVIPDPYKVKLKPPPRKDPNPMCEVCGGEGELVNDFDMVVICECTVIPAG